MKKHISIILIILNLIFMSGCEVDPSLTINLYALTYTPEPVIIDDDFIPNSQQIVVQYSFIKSQTPIYIDTLEEYTLATPQTIDTETIKYSSAFFEENSLFVIPYITEKSPIFALTSFDLTEGKLSFDIKMTPKLIRESNNFINSQGFYQIVVEINTNNIESFDYQILEQDNILHRQQQNLQFAPLEENSTLITSYQAFEEAFYNQKINTMYQTGFLSFINEETFIDNNIFVYQSQIHAGDYLSLEDVYVLYKENLDDSVTRILIVNFIYREYSGTLPVPMAIFDNINIIVIPKDVLVDVDDTDVTVFTASSWGESD